MQEDQPATGNVTAVKTDGTEAGVAQARSTPGNRMDGNAFAGWDGVLRLTRQSAESFGSSTRIGMNVWRDANACVLEWWNGTLRDGVEAFGAVDLPFSSACRKQREQRGQSGDCESKQDEEHGKEGRQHPQALMAGG